MAAIEVPTFEQIATILSQLATNYSNIFADYYNLFYNPVPMDITVQIYDEAGNLATITIPNRAKDRTYILNGNGDPNNSVSAPKGSIYQDLTNGTAYIKQFANTDNTGWSEFMTLESLEDYLIQGAGSPEGVVAAPKGILYIDKTNVALYLKSTATGNIGWNLISANTSNLTNRDLSNLSEIGESHFANPSLSNLNAAGTNLINSKENVSNKTTAINASSTDVQYPTAKAVYDLVGTGTSDLANKSLSNLNETGEDKFVHTETQVRDCIFKATSLPSFSGNIISVPTGTILLCADGRDANKASTNTKVTLSSAKSVSISWTGADEGVVFYNNSTGNLIYYPVRAYLRSTYQPSGYTNMIWYNPDTNKYSVTSDSGSTWTDSVIVEVGRFKTDSSGNITEFNTYHPLTAAMEDDIRVLSEEKVNKRDLYEVFVVVETYENGNSWYRVWSDGWCEQGGLIINPVEASATEISLLKNFVLNNYTVTYSFEGTNGNAYVPDTLNKTVSSFQYIKRSDGTNYVTSMAWVARGYVEVVA